MCDDISTATTMVHLYEAALLCCFRSAGQVRHAVSNLKTWPGSVGRSVYPPGIIGTVVFLPDLHALISSETLTTAEWLTYIEQIRIRTEGINTRRPSGSRACCPFGIMSMQHGVVLKYNSTLFLM